MGNAGYYIGILVLIGAGIALVVAHDDGAILGMNNADFADSARLLALMLVLGSMLAFARTGLRQHLRAALVWFVLGFGLVMGYTFRYELEHAGNRLLGVMMPGRPVVIGEAVTVYRAPGGQFVIDNVRIGSGRIEMLVDTGASATTLTQRDASRVGIDIDSLRFNYLVSTANGEALVARVRLPTLEIGPIILTNVDAFVTGPGALSTSLLGMNVLDRFSSIEIAGDQLTLRP